VEWGLAAATIVLIHDLFAFDKATTRETPSSRRMLLKKIGDPTAGLSAPHVRHYATISTLLLRFGGLIYGLA
jgi:hypothetical protein